MLDLLLYQLYKTKIHHYNLQHHLLHKKLLDPIHLSMLNQQDLLDQLHLEVQQDLVFLERLVNLEDQ